MGIVFAEFQSAGAYLISQNCWRMMEICLVSIFASSLNILEQITSNSIVLCISKCCSRLLIIFSCFMETVLFPVPVFQLRWLGIWNYTIKDWGKEGIRHLSLFFVLCRYVLTVFNKGWRFSLVLLLIAYIFIETFLLSSYTDFFTLQQHL